MKAYRVIFDVKECRTENTYFYELFAKNKADAIAETEKRWYVKHKQHMFHKRAEIINTENPISRFQWDIEENFKR